MCPITQPMTDEERARVRDFMKSDMPFSKGWMSTFHPRPEDAFVNAAPDPVQFDWLALNREISE